MVRVGRSESMRHRLLMGLVGVAVASAPRSAWSYGILAAQSAEASPENGGGGRGLSSMRGGHPHRGANVPHQHVGDRGGNSEKQAGESSGRMGGERKGLRHRHHFAGMAFRTLVLVTVWLSVPGILPLTCTPPARARNAPRSDVRPAEGAAAATAAAAAGTAAAIGTDGRPAAGCVSRALCRGGDPPRRQFARPTGRRAGATRAGRRGRCSGRRGGRRDGRCYHRRLASRGGSHRRRRSGRDSAKLGVGLGLPRAVD